MTTVLEYLEDTPQSQLKQVITVKRTQVSKYLFYLLVRHYRINVRKRPVFITYLKSELPSVKGLLEEISIFGADDMYVLEGFPSSFISNLELPKGIFVIAEVDDGELEAPTYGYKQRRGAIKVIMTQLGLKLPLREMLALDWGSIRDYAELEVTLRKATIAGWGVDKIEKYLTTSTTGNILLMIKKGDLKSLLSLGDQYNDGWLTRHITKLIPQLATYKSLVAMGQTPQRIAEALEISNYRLRELEEASKSLTMVDLRTLAERVLVLDKMFMKHQELATELLVMRSGISIRR